MQNQEQIISYILEQNILDEKTLQEVLKEQEQSGLSLIGVLKKNNFVDEEQFIKIVAASHKIEFVNLSPDMINPIAAHMITYEMANQYNIIPVKKENNKLLVAMSSPLNLAVRDEIEMRTGLKVVPLAATQEAIRQAVIYHFNVKNVTRQAIASMRLTTDSDKDKLNETELEYKSSQVADAPITKLVSSIINSAIDANASDIHIEPEQPDMRVRYRVDGILHDAIKVPSSAHLEVVSHIKVAADMDISERRIPQDGHMIVRHDGKEYDMRVSSLPGMRGEKIVIRILDRDAIKWSLDAVVPSPEDNRKFRELAGNPYGMLLLTGPTGSGKTTTLYSVLKLLNTTERNIVTVEDPVEYHLDGITQMQVKPIAGITFASALRSIVRQDPDIILIGEIRDYETAEIAISAALTGHLVLSTLHTNDAAGAISRLINLGVAPFLVASALLGTIAQRLVRTCCSKCRKVYKPSEDDLKCLFGKSAPNEKIELYRGAGCDSCYHTGYHGRKGVFEILPVSPAIRKMITDGCDNDAIRQQAVKEGMSTLHEGAVKEVLDGVTTVDEIIRVINMRTE
ncbi:MAG: GspE/PulE family protein [Phycisphaerae bacterium]|nr:GspE/PulE family protein [Phycisphaerae bacterium]